jgi:hypothetical protein
MPYLLMLAPTSETSPNLRPRVIALPFDFDDILNEEGLSLTRDRYYEMKRIFSTLNSTVVQNVARTYPILLALQSQQLECAKNKIVENLPNVSFEYIFQQKSAGLEFFVACASSEFNFTKQIASLRGTSGLDDPILLQEFIRRVPHALTNRYQVDIENPGI